MENLKLATTYDVEIPAGLFSDVSGNTFSGINNKEIWYFTTNDWPIYSFSFDKCSPVLIDEWQVANLLGDSTWRCTSDGYPSNNGIIINGFTPGIGGRDNNDWLISPSLDLSLYTNPTLAFALKSRFKGMPLKIYIAVNQASRPEPGSNNWKELEVIYPTLRDENWRQIASLDITKYKSPNTYIAFQYLSNTEKGASQLFLDDIKIIAFTRKCVTQLGTGRTRTHPAHLRRHVGHRPTAVGVDLDGTVKDIDHAVFVQDSGPSKLSRQGHAQNQHQQIKRFI